MDITPEQQAFRIGFLFKLAELKLDPQDLNDAIEVVQKTGSVLLPLAVGTSVLLPSILKTIVEGGINIPSAAGSIAGTGIANAQADAADMTPEEAMKTKVLRDLHAQITKAKTQNNNKILSDISTNY